MAAPKVATIKLAAASANNICLSQTPGAAGAMTINGAAASGGVATLDVARRVLITPAGNESAKTFVITGQDRNGNVISETLAGVNNPATAQSLLDYLKVTSITISAAAAAAITIGTSGVASTAWMMLDYLLANFNVGYFLDLQGQTANVDIQVTADEIDSAKGLALPNPVAFTPPTAFGVASGTALAANTLLGSVIPARACRLTVNSGATTGSGIKLSVIQSGIHD